MNILVIGNGFDLAHGLPTKYEHFLQFVELFKEFYEKDKTNKLDLTKLKDLHDKKKETDKDIITLMLVNFFNNKYDTGDPTTEDEGKKEHARKIIGELNSIFLDNVWIDYFRSIYKERIENGKDGWIDFESEISRVIQTIDKDMKNSGATENTVVRKISESFFEAYFLDDLKIREQVRDAEGFILCEKMSVGKQSEFMKKYREEHPVESLKTEITYRNLIIRLENDLNKLIRALEIYLTDFVEKIEITKISKDIKNLAIDHVLSFNYTNTFEELYGQERNIEYDYIHGKADIKNTIESNNMVLGIDEYLSDDRKNNDIEFIAFKKFYQRIYKETGCKYKEWVDQIERNEHMSPTILYKLYILGHSLDVTDKDILRDLILHDNVHTTIFYLNKDVMGQQIANLVKVIGQDELIKRTGGSTKTIEFKLQQDMVEI